MQQKYQSEYDGMREFYHELGLTPDYSCSTDGRIDGTLFEFKTNSTDHHTIYHNQCKRYLKAYNSKALPIPGRSIVITLNTRKYTIFNNATDKVIQEGIYNNPNDVKKYISTDYIKGTIDEYSIVAYNDLYYSQCSKEDKELFIDELCEPNKLYVHPFNLRAKKNEKLRRTILDCLGGRELKRRLGAFFTPDEYVAISTRYVREAISKVPPGNDYVIIDRACGSGQLQSLLSPEELSHCILNTYVYSEWTTLKGLYEGRVRYIIPETSVTRQSDGTMLEGNALSLNFINTPSIKKYIDDPKCTVILLENPPYGEPQAGAARHTETFTSKDCYISQEMKREGKYGIASRDLTNRFIWSMDYYKPDFVILYAPFKSWKVQGLLSDYKPTRAHVANRKHFHATEGAIGLILWEKHPGYQCDEIIANCDIPNKKVNIKKIHNGCAVNNNRIPLPDGNPFALLTTSSFEPDFKNGGLGNTDYYEKLGGSPAKKIAENNCLMALPLWVANCYVAKDYTEKGTIGKSSDMGLQYKKDNRFLHDCLIWSCLTYNNRCISNGVLRNELCLSQDTVADKLLDTTTGKYDDLLAIWYDILKLAKSTDEYNESYTYGLRQICTDINIKVPTGRCTKTGSEILDVKYPELNYKITELKNLLKVFYDENITPKLFKYELLK